MDKLRTHVRRRLCLAALTVALAGPSALALAADQIPQFHATSLTGHRVTQKQLLGQPTILIVTPSTDAAAQTRAWAKALRSRIDPAKVRVRDVIAVDLPFFISVSDAVGRAKKKIPQRYHDQTWLSGQEVLENALGIPPDSHKAFVLSLDAQGQVIQRFSGAPTDAEVGKIVSAMPSTH